MRKLPKRTVGGYCVHGIHSFVLGVLGTVDALSRKPTLIAVAALFSVHWVCVVCNPVLGVGTKEAAWVTLGPAFCVSSPLKTHQLQVGVRWGWGGTKLPFVACKKGCFCG